MKRLKKKDFKRIKKYSAFGLSFLVIAVFIAIALIDDKKAA